MRAKRFPRGKLPAQFERAGKSRFASTQGSGVTAGLTLRAGGRFIPSGFRECSTMDSVVASEAIDPGSTPGIRTTNR